MRDAIHDYLITAGDQIRWNRARPALLAELEDHLRSEEEACRAAGLSETEAQAEAVRQMGDPVMIGQELDSVHRPRPQWKLLGLTLAVALAVTGLRLFLTWCFRPYAGFPEDFETFFSRELGPACLALCLGTGGLLAGYFLDYTTLARWAKILFLGALLLSFLLLPFWSPLIRLAYYGEYLLLLTVPTLYGGWVYNWRKQKWLGLILSIIGAPAALGACFWAKYREFLGMGTMLTMGAVLLVLLASLTWGDWFALGKKPSRCLAVGLLSGSAIGFLYFTTLLNPVHQPLPLLLHPERYTDTYGACAAAIRDLLGTVPLIGQAKWNGSYPVGEGADTLLLTTTLRQYGWLPFLLFAGSLMLLAVWLLVRGLRQTAVLGRITAVSVALPMLCWTVLGILGNLGIQWIYVTLPLISGNCILAVQMTLIGLALSVFRQESLPPAEVKARPLFFFIHEVR